MSSTSSRYADFMARRNKALGHVLVDGKWTQKFKRDPDAQSPTGGVSSSVNDLTKWLRLQLANGKFEGKQIVDEKALAETHHPHMLTGFNPFTQLPTFYGLGWNVGYDPGRSIALKSLRRVWSGRGDLCESGARRATGHRGADECVSARHSGSTRERRLWISHCMANPLKIGFRCLNRCIPTRQRLGRCLGSIIPNHRHRRHPR